MVFQNYALYPHMSVYDNMAYGLRNRGTPKDEIDKRVQEAARILAIEPFLERKPRAALGRPAPARRHGPRHRAQAAGVPVRRAAVEPRRQAARADARRDQAAAARARRHLDLRHARPGRGDDAVRQARGDERRRRSSRSARPSEVYRRPADALRRDLHRLAADEHPARHGRGPGPRRASARRCSRSPTCARASPPGTPVEVGLRPEDVRARRRAGAARSTIDVDFVEELGATQLFHGKLAGAEFVVQAPTGQIAADARALSLSIDPANVHLFDPQTAQRLGRLNAFRQYRCPPATPAHGGRPSRQRMCVRRSREARPSSVRAAVPEPVPAAYGARSLAWSALWFRLCALAHPE